MKNIFNVVFILVLSFYISACSQNTESAKMADMISYPEENNYQQAGEAVSNLNRLSAKKSMEVSSMDESVNQETVSSNDLRMILAASENHVSDTMLNLIRTADIKFRVNNIIHSTNSIENIVNNLGGYIENTQLINNCQRTYRTQTSADSVLITRHCTATNTITIRIPNKDFNIMLKSIIPYVEHLDYRNINTNDVTIDLIRQQLAQKRAAAKSQRLQKTVDNQRNKLNDVISAEDAIDYSLEREDEAKIQRLIINNRIRLSTIHLTIYQNNIVDKETVAKEQPVKEYQQSFGSKLADGLKNGWFVLESIFLFLISNWSVLLIIAIIIATAGYFKRRRLK